VLHWFNKGSDMAEKTHKEQLDELIEKYGAMNVLFITKNIFEGAELRIEAASLSDKRKASALKLAEVAELQAAWIANLQISNINNHLVARGIRSRIAAKQKRLLNA
jgi:hypothetical protein